MPIASQFFIIDIKEVGMPVRGVRGAISVNKDDPKEILEATRELLEVIVQRNPSLKTEDIASVFFTVSPDLRSVHPAKAARLLGWNQVPLMCAVEIDVPDSLHYCIRVLLHWNSSLEQQEINHVYLREATVLRQDLNAKSSQEK
jgi:chorismate mutase